MKKLIVISLMLVACGGNEWPKQDQDMYLDACVNGATEIFATLQDANSFCHCTLEKLEELYPTIDDAKRDLMKNPAPHEITEIAADCEPK